MAANLTARSAASPSRHGGGDGATFAEDHRGRAGRDPRAQVDRQQDGRPARLVRRRGHPRGPRGRHRRAARRPGRGAQRRGHVAGPHRQRQRAGVEPDDAGAQHRAGHHGGGARRPVAEDHRRRPGRDPGAQVDGEHDGRPAPARSPTRSPVWPARSASRASWAGRRRCAACRARGATSPSTSTSWPPTSPVRCATSPRSPRRWRAATCRRRSPSRPGARSWSSSRR